MVMRWYRLHPATLVVMTEVERPDLKKVEQVGLVTLAPGGRGIAGSANLSSVGLFATAVSR